ncbi:hypothetical protein FQN49_003281 [Arthroderma sp. PD_2]|nr:hypothetical protein FQN49_003281 [Arthroderma sp. PD_2]
MLKAPGQKEAYIDKQEPQRVTGDRTPADTVDRVLHLFERFNPSRIAGAENDTLPTPNKYTIFRSATSPEIHLAEGQRDIYQGLLSKIPPPCEVIGLWRKSVHGTLCDHLRAVTARLGRKLPDAEVITEPALYMSGKKCPPSSVPYLPGETRLTDPVALVPTIWILCGSKRCQKRVKKYMDRATFLDNFRKKFGIGDPYITLGAPWPAAKTDSLHPHIISEDDKISFAVQHPLDNKSACGLKAKFTIQDIDMTEWTSTIGGIILVDNSIFGLTTAHGVINKLIMLNGQSASPWAPTNHPTDMEEYPSDSESESDSDSSSTISENPLGSQHVTGPVHTQGGGSFSNDGSLPEGDEDDDEAWRNEWHGSDLSRDTANSKRPLGRSRTARPAHPQQSSGPPNYISPSNNDEDDEQHRHEWLRLDLPQVIAYQGRGISSGSYSTPTSAPATSDFCLVDANQLGKLWNSFSDSVNLTTFFIDSFLETSKLNPGEVYIVTSTSGYPLKGYLLDGTSSIVLGGGTMKTRKIEVSLDQATGVSGAWVVRGGKLYGCIFAGYTHGRYLHMLPIEDVFRDVADFLGASSVTVASKAQIVKRIGIQADIAVITARALHDMQLLLDDLQRIAYAPRIISNLMSDVRSTKMALTSLQEVTQGEWESFGLAFASYITTAVTDCGRFCRIFKAEFRRCTYQTGPKQTSIKPNEVITFGFNRFESISSRLQICRTTFKLVVDVIAIHDVTRHPNTTKGSKTIINMESEIRTAIDTAWERYFEVAKRRKEFDSYEDGDALEQSIKEQGLLHTSRVLLHQLKSTIEGEFKGFAASRSTFDEPQGDIQVRQKAAMKAARKLESRPPDAIFNSQSSAQETSPGKRLVGEPLYDVDAFLSESNRQQSLCLAAREGDKNTVQALLDAERKFVFFESEFVSMSLYWAARNGHTEVIRMLVPITGYMNWRDKDERTALYWAARNGHEKVVRLLVDSGGVDKRLKDIYGQTALYWAARNGREKMVRLLLDNGGVDIRSKDIYGQTALYWAARNGHKGVVQLLMTTGQSTNRIVDEGPMPLYWAARNGYSEAAESLLADYAANAYWKDQNGRTTLCWAARNGHDEVVELLLAAYDKNINVEDSDGQTPLSWAIRRGREGVVELLLASDEVRVNQEDGKGRTPLDWAKMSGDKWMILLLENRGARVGSFRE